MPGPAFCLRSAPVLGTGSQSVFVYTESGTWYQILLSILFTGSVVGCQILWYLVSDLMPDPVLGTRSYVFCPILDLILGTRSQSVVIYTGSGTGYQILLSILFTRSVVRCQILCFICSYWVRYWVPDFMPDMVLGTRSYFN